VARTMDIPRCVRKSTAPASHWQMRGMIFTATRGLPSYSHSNLSIRYGARPVRVEERSVYYHYERDAAGDDKPMTRRLMSPRQCTMLNSSPMKLHTNLQPNASRTSALASRPKPMQAGKS